MYDAEKLIERLDEIAEQGRQNATNLKLISTKLFGSEEDHFEAGRLPILERAVDSLIERTATIEGDQAQSSGRRTVLHAIGGGLGKFLLAAAGAIAGAIFGIHRR